MSQASVLFLGFASWQNGRLSPLGRDYFYIVIVYTRETVSKGVFVHTSIRTGNMDRSIDFYTRLMGLRLLSRREIPQNDAEIAFLQDPDGKGARLELTFYRKQKKFIQPEYEDRLFDHLAFEVRDMKKSIATMRKEKVTITDEPFRLGPTGPLIAFIEDPDGTLIELIERGQK